MIVEINSCPVAVPDGEDICGYIKKQPPNIKYFLGNIGLANKGVEYRKIEV